MKNRRILLLTIMLFAMAAHAFGQTTEFTYQGSLKDGANLASGNYDMEFAVFDAENGGTQIGSPQTRLNVGVSAGIFSVKLDFGAIFPGPDRFLEIRVRNGGGAFTTLSPRQRIGSSPYAVKSLIAESAVNATTATSATIASNFTGNLAGDVTGTQAATTVARLQGKNVANTNPVAGQVLKYNGTTNQWEPATDETASGSGGGTITGVTAGTGLTGGGASGNVALAIANGGVGTAQIADSNVTDPKIFSVSATKIIGAVANSQQLGGIAANQYVQTTDPRLTDARSPTAGSSNYIQNTNGQQAASNFNISGNGTANTFNAVTQFNIGGQRVFSVAGTNNVFAGTGTGGNNTGFANSFFGYFAGNANTGGTNNTFTGANAGLSNTNGTQNTFLGSSAGRLNTIGESNTFVGTVAGQSNVTGVNNSFFGNAAGAANTSSNNSFFGAFAGSSNVGGQGNSFFGTNAGDATTEGDNNAFFGFTSGSRNTTGNRNSFFGRGAGFENLNGDSNAFFGADAGNKNTSADSNSFFGTSSGFSTTTGGSNLFAGSNAGNQNTTGASNTFVGGFAGQGNNGGSNNTLVGRSANVGSDNLSFASAFGSNAVVSTSNTVVLGRNLDTVQIPGNLTVAGTFTGPVAAGSTNYVQNTTVQQASTNFNISGNGTAGGTFSANNVNASNQFNIGGFHVLSRPGNGNLFAGLQAGQSNTGTQNSFFGHLSGSQNGSGVLNAFFGYLSGQNTTTGSSNAFFGADAGKGNVSGGGNSFFGRAAGQDNITGDYNSFFGFSAGPASVVGTGNVFFGYQSGQVSTAGDENVFVGYRSGFNNTLGDNNTLVGSNADVTSTNLSFAAAIGSGATVSSSNTIALGRSAGQDTVRIPGDLFVLNGTDAEPGSGGYIISGLTSSTNIAIDNNEIMARNNGAVATLALNADGGNVHLIQAGTGNVGIGTTAPDQKLTVNGNASKTGGTSWAVFSDERLKNIKGQFSLGLDVIKQLQPIRFEYRADNPLGLASTGEQIGFSAQEVQKILPEAVTTSRNGYLQLNVDPILWTMLNGIKEQDSELEKLRNQVREQNALISDLKKALCEIHPLSEMCKK